MIQRHELIVDNFAGGGGASTGIEAALGRPIDIAINHDPEAIEMHRRNHPRTRHLCESVWDVDIVGVTEGRPVGLAWFSPDCKHFSKAKGGKPVKKEIRGLAWVAVKWAELKKPRVICLENVEEFQDWGPLLDDEKPDPARKGVTFRRWVGRLRNLGYSNVEWREIRACDHGAPTIRKRLVLVARCDGQPIHWPAATHGPGLQPYRTAADCIDWERPCPSIFLSREEGRAIGVNRPLADATMRRIARGVDRYVINAKEPFIVSVNHGDSGGRREYSIREPLTTQTQYKSSALVTPFLTSLTHQGGDRNEDLQEPFRVITGAHRGEKALVVPFLSAYYGANREGGDRIASIQEPLRTQPTENRHALVATFLSRQFGASVGSASQKPVGTVTAGGGGKTALVTALLSREGGSVGSDDPLDDTTVEEDLQFARDIAFMAQHNTGRIGRAATDPVSTIMGRGTNQSLVTSNIVKLRGTNTGHGTNEPLHTISAGGTHLGEVRAFLLKYYGTDQAPELRAPMHTVTSKDRMALCIVWLHGEPWVITDVGMRMLTPEELYRAQGFPDTYQFDGYGLTKTAQVRMCGNSVCPPMAEAVVRAQFEGGVRQEAA